VSLDAQDWVWNHSTSKGTARLVLLAIADKAYGKGCSAYAGTTMLVQRSNAARSSVVAAVDKLIESGELAVVEGQQGPRGETVYALPKARRHRRSDLTGGPESGPVDTQVDGQNGADTPRNDTQNPTSDSTGGPDSVPVRNPDRSGFCTGPDSVPGGSGFRTPGGPKSGPHNRKNTNTNPPSPHAAPQDGTHEGQPDRIPRAFDYIQPLVTAMTEAGIRVTWQMKPEDIQAIAVVQQRAGIEQMVAFARNAQARAREPISFATFFLKAGWRGLPPAAAPRPAADTKPPHCNDPDCDPITRTRESEDARGIRSLTPCPACHPTAKGRAA
jgi:hypothetical protein